MAKQYDIYGIGAALVDTEITVTDDDLTAMGVDKGVMTLVDEERQHEIIGYLQDHLVASQRASGGSGANTIIAAGYFGCHNFYSCKVANDDNGSFYLQDIKDAKVSYPTHVGQDEGITGKCLVMITPDAERTMNTFLGLSATVSTTELDEDAISASQWSYIEGYLVSSDTGREAAIKLRQLSEQHNTKVALSLSDPAMVQFFKDGLTEMIGGGVDLLFCNRDEALGFTQTENIDDAIIELQRCAKTFAITLGAEGSLVFDGTDLMSIPTAKAKAIDTNGAGDMYAGAFLYALSQGEGYERAGRFANLAATKVVTQYGPRLKAEQHQELKTAFFG
ncbi:adenosine kinase [Gilvimarinus agarilyticus]|uniref:adenosine kinase n=1 Tax=unclassified Gilvimarinus TaxID=2642066 RepID=UPI001C093280|nr:MULTISPECIES: adenosine kinase [unclassified Gilvimarinus]MBU2886090.1 adenosine kinase [Gilvimarinus agarilyticus]MDO6570799.1 adenosine kinase [Gilvimarinus sp. 2_MG-2023]MDO6746967.1 adenosine kinase [Gilvimarinus sp. 1_MG-2023]